MQVRAFEDRHVIDGSLEQKDADINPGLLVGRNFLDVEGFQVDGHIGEFAQN